MASSMRPELLTQLPASFSPLQAALLSSLIEHGCLADMGQGPVLGTNTEASSSCRICLEALAGELTLRHESNAHTAIPGADVQPPCRRTYHLICLVEWAESNLEQKKPISCPGDRQLLIPAVVSDQIREQFQVRPPLRHNIRAIDNVVRFWENATLETRTPPRCRFGIRVFHLEHALGMASEGFDVGFVSADTVRLLPLDHNTRRMFDEFDRHYTQDGRFSRVGRPLESPTFETYVYIEIGRELIDHLAGTERTEFYLVPATNAAIKVFRRYLLGMVGEAYSIDVYRRRRRDKLRVDRVQLNDSEIINLHVETQIRNMMLQSRVMMPIPPTVVWYWPFNNQGGGIVVGGRLDDRRERYPARRYALHNLHVGQANNQRYAALVARTADSSDPSNNAALRNDALIRDYVEGRLPQGFPQDYDLGSGSIHVPMPHHVFNSNPQQPNPFHNNPVDATYLTNHQQPQASNWFPQQQTQQQQFPQQPNPFSTPLDPHSAPGAPQALAQQQITRDQIPVRILDPNQSPTETESSSSRGRSQTLSDDYDFIT